MKTKILVLLALLVAGMDVSAQKDQTIFGNRGIKWTGFWGGYTTNISTFQDDFNVGRSGFFLFELNKRVLIGWDGIQADLSSPTKQLELKSNGFTFGYSPLAHRAIHPVFNIYGGTGKVLGEYAQKVYVWQPSIALEMNVFRWMKIGIDGGYRFVTNNNLKGISEKELSGAYAGLKLKFGWSWRH